MAQKVMSTRVIVVPSDSRFQSTLVQAEDKLVVVSFFATWCGPCRTVAPKFIRLSNNPAYANAMFLKVDVDICRNTAKRYEVTAMPTFALFRNRELIVAMKGANIEPVESAIMTHIGPSPSSVDETSGPASSGASSTVSVPGQISLLNLIDKSGSECLNENDSHPFTDAIAPGDGFLESDCDEQLVVMLAFQQPVKLHSLQLVGPDDGRAAKTVKLFINQTHTLDFDAAEQRKPTQEFSLTADNTRADSLIPLQYVKYQNVQTLTLFVKDNQGDCETTVINHIGVYGSTLDATNMKEFKRVAGEKGERHG